ncbi:MAG TPA: hypothetical protein VF765_31235 [Polyangiaceae bacterium]
MSAAKKKPKKPVTVKVDAEDLKRVTERLERGDKPVPGQRRMKFRADAQFIKIRSGELRRALRAVMLCARKDKELPHLTAVHFAASDELVLSATDGHLLAQWRSEPEELPATPAAMLVELADIQRLVPLLASDEKGQDAATVNFDAGTVTFTDGTILSLRKVDREPPPYNDLWLKTKRVAITEIGLSPVLVTRAMKAFREAAGSDIFVHAQLRGTLEPVWFTSPQCTELQILLCPARVDAPTFVDIQKPKASEDDADIEEAIE